VQGWRLVCVLSPIFASISRRPGRVGGATGQPWGPTARRERAGSVGVGDSMVLAHRGHEVARGGGGEMAFLDLWMGLRCWESVGVERERRRGRWCTRQQPQRPRTRRLNSTNTPRSRPLRFLTGQRIHTTGRCDADRSEIPRLKRRPGRVGGATGQPWGPTARRERAGSVGVYDSTHTVLMEG
jgi:hypothetical protein